MMANYKKAKKGSKKRSAMDKEELASYVKLAIDEAETYIDTYIAPNREKAMRYYKGDPFGDEEENRSDVILTDVRDTVLGMLPSLLRVFTGPDRVIEFTPRTADDIPIAEQMTDVVGHVFMQQNPGFQIMHDAMKDALLLKTGILTWHATKVSTVEEDEYRGLTLDQADFLSAEPGAEVVSREEYSREVPGEPDGSPDGLMPDMMDDPAMVSEQPDAGYPSPGVDPQSGPLPPEMADLGSAPPGMDELPISAPAMEGPPLEGPEALLPPAVDETVDSLDPLATGALPPDAEEVFVDLRIRRVREAPRYVVECVPPDEFLVNSDATCLDDAVFVGRRQLVTVSDLIEMGYDREEVESNAGNFEGFEENLEAQTRNPADTSAFFGTGSNVTDKSTEKVYYCESYIKIDKDGDGIAELHRVCSIGKGSVILHDEVVSDLPYALLCPNPTPHTIFGESIADQTMDLQLIKSRIMRSVLDGLAQTINPRMAVLENAVNMSDVLNNEPGAVIRTRTPGAVMPIDTTFSGTAAMGIIAYLDELRTQRTGMSRASQGLDPDMLQSTTSSAVQAQLSSSQERTEMITRLFADGFKRCYQGILSLVVRNQDKPMIVRLRDKFIEADPRDWDSNMDMTVTLALGRGSDEQRMAFLNAIAEKQEAMIQQMGPVNPVADIKEYSTTLEEMAKLSGFQEPNKFVKILTDEGMAEFSAMLEQQNQQQPADPNQLLAEVEAEKIRADMQIEASKMELATKEAVVKADYDRDKLFAESYLKATEFSLKHEVEVDATPLFEHLQNPRFDLTTFFIPQTTIGAGSQDVGAPSGPPLPAAEGVPSPAPLGNEPAPPPMDPTEEELPFPPA